MWIPQRVSPKVISTAMPARCDRGLSAGWKGILGSGTAKGYSLFLAAGGVQDPNVGYLLSDAFTVEVRIGRVLPQNKSLRIESCGETCICTVRTGPSIAYAKTCGAWLLLVETTRSCRLPVFRSDPGRCPNRQDDLVGQPVHLS